MNSLFIFWVEVASCPPEVNQRMGKSGSLHGRGIKYLDSLVCWRLLLVQEPKAVFGFQWDREDLDGLMLLYPPALVHACSRVLGWGWICEGIQLLG
jgi:hypothetical protein